MRLMKLLPYRISGMVRRFQKEGFWKGLTSLTRLIVFIFYEHSEYVVITHTLSDEHLTCFDRSDLSIRQITSHEEITEFDAFVDPVDMVRFNEMLDRGSICFSASKSGEVVGCAWVSQEVDKTVNRVQPPVSPGDACSHDLFISPKHRGQGIGEALIRHRLLFMREQGYKRMIGAVRKDNEPALKVNKKTGHVRIGEMSHRRLLFWDWFRYDIANT